MRRWPIRDRRSSRLWRHRVHRGRDERDRRHDHFIAWSDTERFERHLESHSAIHRAQPEAALLERGKLLLESRDYRVISAPFIARENFLDWLEQESKRLGISLPKGASDQVVAAAREVVARYGEDRLKSVAKLSFKTTQKVLNG